MESKKNPFNEQCKRDGCDRILSISVDNGSTGFCKYHYPKKRPVTICVAQKCGNRLKNKSTNHFCVIHYAKYLQKLSLSNNKITFEDLYGSDYVDGLSRNHKERTKDIPAHLMTRGVGANVSVIYTHA